MSERDLEFGHHVDTVTLVAIVWRHAQVHVQIARRATTRPDRTAARESQRRTGVDASGNIHLIRLVGDDATLALA